MYLWVNLLLNPPLYDRILYMIQKGIQWNWRVIGNRNIADFLQNNIAKNNLAHAYLFAGPEKVGRKILAYEFISSLFCEDKNVKPCGKCRQCQQIAKGIHPDVYHLSKLEEKKDIIIEQVRELQNKLSLGAFSNGYKVAVIDGADLLNESSANSFLKTLEEPTAKTIIILIAEKVDFLPATILSRCQILKFLPVKEKEIFDYLLSLGAQRAEAENLAHLSFGRPGLALDLFRQRDLLEEHNKRVNDFFLLSQGEIYERFEIINNLANSKIERNVLVKNLDSSLGIWASLLRDMAYIKNDSLDFIANLNVKEKLQKLAQRYSLEKIVELMEELNKTRDYLERNVNIRLALENFVLNL
ncbi:MAG: DNA polymerase III subunit delta' [Patescibacteria group bacterium]|nr:DNA polymerase III subunit delta' [Patescibacteria group bacterium]